ncbi:hypothetical protein FE257_008239 [Aspergillus nanangensis]|uniref:Xylanolytic transcriptional activator regulatory domain-containing protein n=1 Tax=Aspergillus nanangensis TaxID=2582783 RepID=A0AAD4CLS5_ASPNN|nr:hypothetical protein FE257_008239 [Aspergillus nanangensis]
MSPNFCALSFNTRLKCDRGCSKQGVDHLCIYAATTGSRGPADDELSPAETLQKIQRLSESLMTMLRQSEEQSPAQQSSSSEPSEYDDRQTLTFGSLRSGPMETSYIGACHWGSILEQIMPFESVVSGLDTYKTWPEFSTRSVGLLSGQQKHLNKLQMLSDIPSRPVAEQLVHNFFSITPSASILHKGTFLGQLSRFWENPLSTPTMWIAVLFGIMSISLFFGDQAHDESCCLHGAADGICKRAFLLREKLVNCLVAGGYTTPSPFTLEALMIYFIVEHCIFKDSRTENWLTLGTVVRVAMRLGLHRDPSHFPELSTLCGEMRRRQWRLILLWDCYISVQMGQPAMINMAFCDTTEPTDMSDEGLNEDMTELPPSELGPANGPIGKLVAHSRLFLLSRKIFDLITTVEPPRHSMVQKFEQSLQDVRSGFPANLQMLPLPQLLLEVPEVSIARLRLDILFHFTRSILHHRYLTTAPHEPSFPRFRSACIESALCLVNHQVYLDQEAQKGGPLYSIRWSLTSLMTHAFLLASGILCVDLNRDLARASTPQQDTGAQEVRALQTVLPIWERASARSAEAQRIARAASLILWKVTQAAPSCASSNTPRLCETFDFGTCVDSAASADDPMSLLSFPLNFQYSTENMLSQAPGLCADDWLNIDDLVSIS